MPFRLTPNLVEFLTSTGVNGVLNGCMVAAARCFVQPNYKVESLLKAILRDEAIAWWGKKRQDDPNLQPHDIDGKICVPYCKHFVCLSVSVSVSLAL